MKARIPYSILARFLKNAKRLTKNASLLGNMSVEISKREGTLFAGVRDVGYIQHFPVTYNPEGSSGRMVLDIRKLSALIPKAKKEERDCDVTLDEGMDGMISVTWGGKVLGSFRTSKTDEILPTPETCNVMNRGPVYLKSAALDALVAVSGAVSDDPCLRALVNVQMTLEGSQATFVATDGHRLHLAQTPAVSFAEHGPGARKYLIGTDAISILNSLTGGERNLTFDYQDMEGGGAHTYFGWGSGCVVCRSPDVTYPDYRELLKIRQEGQIIVDRASLLDAVECACRAAKGVKGGAKKTLVDLNGAVKLTGEFDGTAFAREIPYKAKAGPDVVIGLNCEYLRDALELLASETVTLNFTNDLALFVIRDNESARIALVMPIRI